MRRRDKRTDLGADLPSRRKTEKSKRKESNGFICFSGNHKGEKENRRGIKLSGLWNEDACGDNGNSSFYKLVDNNLHLFNEKGVWLDFNGEPLVDRYFFKRVKYLKSRGLKVRISTNGALLHETNRYALATSGIDYIVVSVSTLDRETYKRIRGIDNLSLVLSNLLSLKKI